MEKKQKTIITVIAIALVLLAVAGSYAFFVTNVNNDNKQVVELKTANMSLRFADNDEGISASLDFGKSITKEFLIENTGPVDATANMYWKDLTNTYLEQSLTYKLEYKTSADGTDFIDIPVSSPNVPRSESPTSEVLAEGFTIPSKTTYYYRLTITLEHLDEIDQTQDFNAKLSTWFDLEESKPKPTADDVLAVLQKNGTVYNPVTPDFALAETGNGGLYSMADDYTAKTGKPSYYFRGAVPDNYVKFGGFFWRIIRINGDGSLRMIYDGKQAYNNGTLDDSRNAVSGVIWAVDGQRLHDDAKYVGYMYGPANTSVDSTTHSTSRVQAQTNTVNSNAKDQVENWYRTNMSTNAANESKDLTPYLADKIFCNDRSLPSDETTWWTSQDSTYSNLGWGAHATPYGAFSRTWDVSTDEFGTPTPTFVCPENTTVSAVNDKFTVNTSSGGNGKLTYPVGLITADEIVAAGSGKGSTTNTSYYLYKSSKYFSWSLSPKNMHTNGYAYVFAVHSQSYLSDANVSYMLGAISPVINLKPEYAANLQGKGTMIDPYYIEGVN